VNRWTTIFIAGLTLIGGWSGPLAGQEPAARPTAAPAGARPPEAMRDFLAIGAPPDPAAVKRGQTLFVANCGFCHGSSANGGASGPDLVRSVLVLHDHGSGKEIGPVILTGRISKGMPKFEMTNAQIQDIAAFLLSRNQAAANRMGYTIRNVVTGDAASGRTYFDGHCASCHSASGDLAHIAAKYQPVDLQSRFLYPQTRGRGGSTPARDPRSERTVTVTLASGQTYTGRLDYRDDFSVALTTPSGEYHSWNLDAEKGIEVRETDPLEAHSEMLPKYSDADMHNVLAYLETLR